MKIRLIEMDDELAIESLPSADPSLISEVVVASKELMEAMAARAPWVCYLAEVDGRICGTCAFKGPPQNGRVEIAYFTFPGNESRGIATGMGQALIGIARSTDPTIEVYAQTLIDRNASHRVLEKLGFQASGRVHHEQDGEVLEWILPFQECSSENPQNEDLSGIPNLGPKSQQMLALAGITTFAQLRQLGAVAAYDLAEKAGGRNVSLNLLWAIEGALTGLPWQVVAREHRARLLLELERLQNSD
ncbi:MAG: GNAT family N-acetyltransferase [Pirellula sp.]|nr:GNAT family N-acetyltransferase [Pirellula sp.]